MPRLRRWTRDGLPGLLAERPGPRRAHKLTSEIVGFLEQALQEDPSLRAAGLAAVAADRFGITVHPRSVERALARRRGPKSQVTVMLNSRADHRDLAARYEDLRAAALGGRACAGHGLALLASRGMAAWMAAWRSLPAPGPPAVPAPAGPAPDGVVAVLASMAAACLARRG